RPASSADRAGIETRVRQIVAQLMGGSPHEVKPEASFIDLGYDSFLLIQLADALSAEFQADINQQLLYFERDSCASLAEYLEGVAPPPPATRSVLPAAPDPRPTRVTAPVPQQFTPQQPAPAPASSQAAPRHSEEELEWARRTPVSRRVTEE